MLICICNGNCIFNGNCNGNDKLSNNKKGMGILYVKIIIP